MIKDKKNEAIVLIIKSLIPPLLSLPSCFKQSLKLQQTTMLVFHQDMAINVIFLIEIRDNFDLISFMDFASFLYCLILELFKIICKVLLEFLNRQNCKQLSFFSFYDNPSVVFIFNVRFFTGEKMQSTIPCLCSYLVQCPIRYLKVDIHLLYTSLEAIVSVTVTSEAKRFNKLLV